MSGTDSSTQPPWLDAWEIRKRPICELLWVGVPLLAQRLSRALATVTLDGSYLAARPGTGALLPPFALLLGFFFGWFDPGSGVLLYQNWVVLAGIVVFAALSGYLGLLFALGYSLGDLLLGAPSPEGAASWTSAPLAMGVPLLIEYIALAVFAAQLALISKGLARQIPLPKVLTGTRHFAAIAVIEAVAAGLASWGWVSALPIVLRPRLTWSGFSEPSDALGSASSYAMTLAAMAIVITLARLFLQHRSGFDQSRRPWLDHLDQLRQSVPAAAEPLVERVPPIAMLGLQVFFATLMLAGLIEGWIDAIVAAAVIGSTLAARTGILPILGPWPEMAARVPVFARMLAGTAVLALAGPSLLWFFFGQMNGMRPMLFITLLSLVLFLLLLPPAPRKDSAEQQPEADPAEVTG